MTIQDYLKQLAGEQFGHYTAHAKIVDSKPSLLIRPNGTTALRTWTKFHVWLEATRTDYTCCYHYVTQDALGRLSGCLL